MGLLRVLITGDDRFNNYFMAYPYLKELVPPRSIIINRGISGADAIGNVFADSENMVTETYLPNWDTHGKGAAAIRDRNVVMMSRYAIVFWDETCPRTKNLINTFKKNKDKSKLTVINYNVEDVILPSSNKSLNDFSNKLCGQSAGLTNPYASPTSSSNENEMAILKYTDNLIRSPELIKAILELSDDAKLDCYCGLKLCHCDVISWLLKYAKDELKMLLSQFNAKTNTGELLRKKPQQIREVMLSKLEEFSTRGGLYSTSGIKVSEGWSSIIQNDFRHYLEIPDKMMVKKNVHLSKKSVDKIEELGEHNVVSIVYNTNEINSIPITYYKVEFADSPFREGYWYVDVRDVNRK